MNITIDKADTIAALTSAQVAFLTGAKRMREDNSVGAEAMAKRYEKDAETIAILLDQIKTNGKGSDNDLAEQRRAS